VQDVKEFGTSGYASHRFWNFQKVPMSYTFSRSGRWLVCRLRSCINCRYYYQMRYEDEYVQGSECLLFQVTTRYCGEEMKKTAANLTSHPRFGAR